MFADVSVLSRHNVKISGRGPTPIVFAEVGLGLAVADAHPDARAAAHVVLAARGGKRVMEEVELRLGGRWPVASSAADPAKRR